MSLVTGTVKWFGERYGYAMADDRGPDVFLHIDSIEDGRVPQLGMEIEMDVHPTFLHPKNKTRKAMTARLLGKTHYSPIREMPKRKAVAHGD